MNVRLPAAIAATLVGLGALTACGGGGEESTVEPTTQSPEAEESTTAAEETSESATRETSEPEETSSSNETATDAPAAGGEAGTPVAVGETITDDVLGDTVTIAQVIKGFPSTEFANIAEDGGEFVLVEVDVTAGDLYSGGVQGGFKLLSGGETAGSSTGIIDDELEAAGMTPFDGVDGGETGSGWVVFQVNTVKPSYELTYTRTAASVIGSDETIPEQVWTIPLP